MIHSLIQTAYPQALAKLLYLIRDIHNAEDYLQSAVEQALIKWPEQQPDNCVGWLVKVAQNKFIDEFRRSKKQLSSDLLEEVYEDIDLSEQSLLISYNDDILRLIFTSCHPALNQETQIALSLKHVLGLSVSEIGSALLIPKKTIQQRLLRAKKKIAATNIPYEIPKPSSWNDRLSGVLKTIYLLFNEGYLSTDHQNPIRADLCKEAIRLTRLLHVAIKNDPEVIGLLALLLHQDARRPARYDQGGNVVLLQNQDRTLWKKRHISEANTLVYKALKMAGGQPYAVQAAIAALHNNANTPSSTDWPQIYGLYCRLMTLDSNPVIRLNALVALAKSGQSSKAIEQSLELEKELSSYAHYFPTVAGLYFESAQFEQALSFYLKALKQTTASGQVRFLKSRVSQCKEKLTQ